MRDLNGDEVSYVSGGCFITRRLRAAWKECECNPRGEGPQRPEGPVDPE